MTKNLVKDGEIMKGKETKAKYTAPSVVATFEILSFLSKNRNNNSTLTEISKGLDINHSTCYRILQTLVNLNVLKYDKETKRFSLGPYLIVLGNKAAESLDYIRIAKDYLKKISELTKVTTAIAQRVGDEWIYIDREISESPYSVNINVGQRFPLNAGATSKVILSYLSDEERNEILDRIGLRQYTKHTVIDKEEILKELSEIKLQGYAISHNEHVEGISGISFPIENRNGDLEFVVTLVMITTVNNETELIELANKVKVLTDELTYILSRQ